MCEHLNKRKKLTIENFTTLIDYHIIISRIIYYHIDIIYISLSINKINNYLLIIDIYGKS